jgi:signal-transduction protein with cAMP-binding, CBS, and nucleotidyltransferase domain
MTVLDVARTEVVTATPDTSVATVVRRLHEETVSGLVVADGTDPLDLVTDRDLTLALLDDEFDAEQTPVREFVDEDTPTIDADAGIYDTVQTLSNEGVRRGIVVEDGTLAGIVSISDIVVLLGMELNHVSKALQTSSPAYEHGGPEYYRD